MRILNEARCGSFKYRAQTSGLCRCGCLVAQTILRWGRASGSSEGKVDAHHRHSFALPMELYFRHISDLVALVKW
jgi:hypothetical protein